MRSVGIMLLVASACARSITIPARPCVLDGAVIAKAGSQSVFDLFNVMNKIWSQANMSWLACCQDVPTIPDPDTSVGQPGDILISNTIRESTEMKTAYGACRAAWDARGFKDGRIVILVHNLIQPDTSNAQQLGITFPSPSDAARVCVSPPALTVDDVRDVHSFVIEPAMFGYTGTLRPASSNGAQSDVAGNLAHELGHSLMLSHGDGLDNDHNGKWDSFCDSTEKDAQLSLMTADGYNTVITDLQTAFVRVAAMLVPGAVGGPP